MCKGYVKVAGEDTQPTQSLATAHMSIAEDADVAGLARMAHERQKREQHAFLSKGTGSAMPKPKTME